MLESRDPSSLGERIRAGKADPISPEEFEVIDRIKTKFIALYGEERAAQLTGDQYEKEVAGRIIAKYEARYGTTKTDEQRRIRRKKVS